MEAFSKVRKRAESHGISRDAMERVRRASGRRRYTRVVRELTGWNATTDQWSGAQVAAGIRFKSLERFDQQRVAPMVRLARHVTELAAEAFAATTRDLPADPLAIREQLLSDYGEVSLATLTKYLWSNGVLVLALPRSTAFTAAAWNVRGRSAIVIQDHRQSWPYWLFDLAHDSGHIALGHIQTDGVVDIGDIKPQPTGDQDEQDATRFALALLLGDATRLVEHVRAQSQGPRAHLEFKFAVERVARGANVSPAMLGFVAAFELTDVAQDKDRWGSATNLAKAEFADSGASLLQAEANERLVYDRLSSDEAQLLEEMVGR
jgi:hypothetical protein